MSDVRMTVDLSCPREQVWPAVSDGRIVSTWFMPTDLLPVSGGACRFFPAPGTAGFTGPFDADVLEVTPPQRIVMLWRGERLHTNVIWELADTPTGCRLTIVQSGFLGLDGEKRSQDLLSSYGYLFGQRLVGSLSSPASATAIGIAKVPPPAPPDRTWRMRLLSVAGAMVLTVLAATGLATWALSRPPTPALPPVPAASPARGPAQALQPGVTPTPRRVASLTAAYRLSEAFQGGYIGSIAIQASPSGMSDWTATIELPAEAEVTSAWDQVAFARSGTWWIFTPLDAHRQLVAGQEFTFYFQVGGEAKPTACSVDGVPCSGLI